MEPKATQNTGESRRIKLLAYCVGTFAEKYIEIGVIFLSLRVFGSLRIALFAGLVFQVVKFVTALTRIPFAPVTAIISTVSGTFLIYFSSENVFLFLIGMVLCAFPFPYIRVWSKQGLGKVEKPKNIVRAGALILSPFFFPIASCVLALVALALLLVTPRVSLLTPLKMQFKTLGIIQPNHVAMFAHHAHYFAYSYAVPYLLVYRFGIPSVWQGFLFYLGWLAYDIYDFVDLRASWRRFLAGHILAGLSIAALFYSTSPVIASICWFLTGVGGGTVAMLSDLRSANDPSPSANLDVAEHYGHVVGVLLMLLVVEVARLEILGIVAGTLSILTPVIAIWWWKHLGRIDVDTEYGLARHEMRRL
jgi:hypothetical protein